MFLILFKESKKINRSPLFLISVSEKLSNARDFVTLVS